VLDQGEQDIYAEDPAEVRGAIQSVEKIAGLLTIAMLNPATTAATKESEEPNERL